ncbi:MAG: hypothetical protein AMXMBFR84_21520 [Candidatus Hydrogenedentota bacterium]
MRLKPTAILFDMGGVLLESADMWNASGFEKSFPQGLPGGVSQAWFMDMSAALLRAFESMPAPRPALNPRPIIGEWLSKAGMDTSVSSVDRWYRITCAWEVRPLYPFVKPALGALRELGIRMGVISNTLMDGVAPRAHFEREGIMPYFEFTVFSADFGMNKPDASIFRHALDSMRLSPAEAWYIGDKPHRDVCGANGVGMTSVLVDSIYTDRILDGEVFWPDIMIPDIGALPALVRELAVH